MGAMLLTDMTAFGLYSLVMLAIGLGFWFPMFLRKHLREKPPNAVQRGMWSVVVVVLWGIPFIYAAGVFLEW